MTKNFLTSIIYDILGIGEACIDLLLPVSDKFLEMHVSGEKGGAQPISSQDLESIIEKSGQLPLLMSGGSCANALKGLAHLGMRCALLSTVGEDTLGHHFIQHLHQLNIASLIQHRNSQTARVLCLITPDGQRTMRFCLENRQKMAIDRLQVVNWNHVKHLHLESYLFAHGTLIEKAIQLAKQAHVSISIDLSSFEIVRQQRDRILRLLNDVTLVFANLDEIEALTGLPPHEGCLALPNKELIKVILLGKEGCLVSHQQHIFQSPAYPPKHVLDTTGAGDLFASGFLYGYLKGYTLKDCAALGNRLGSAAVEVEGAELPESSWRHLYKTTLLNEAS